MAVAAQKKIFNYSEDKLMCRHGFHQWKLKEPKKIQDAAKKARKVEHCCVCGKDRYVE